MYWHLLALPALARRTWIKEAQNWCHAGPRLLPAHERAGHLARVERRVSERLAEAVDFIRHIPRTVSAERGHLSHFWKSGGERSRLQERLDGNLLCERVMTGDGNCQVVLWA